MLEYMRSTWQKRFMQKHYSYRDSHRATTVLFPTLPPPAPSPEAQELALLAAEVLLPNGPWTVYYPFGYNARNNALTGSRFRWPHTGDYASGTIAPRNQCLAREIMVFVTEDTWIRLISLNPIYLTLIAQGYTVDKLAAMDVPQTITEVEHFVAKRDKDTFYPTYATAIVFRADSAAGMIYIYAEGNVEGGE